MSEVNSAELPSVDSGSAIESNESMNLTILENDNQSQEQTQDQAVKSMKEKFKLIVDGEEIEEEIDFSDKESLKNKLQLAAAAKKRMGESKAEKAKAVAIIKEFENNPLSLLKRLGPKGKEIAEQFILSQIQDEMMSPEEKEMYELRNFKKQIEEEKLKQKETEELTIAEQREKEIAEQFQNTIIQALEKTGLPKSPKLVKRTAELFKANLEYGLELTPDELAREVKNEKQSEIKSLIGEMDASQLIAMFGEDVAKKIRKHDVETLKNKQKEIFQSRPKEVFQYKKQSNDGPEYMSFEEMKEQARQRAKS